MLQTLFYIPHFLFTGPLLVMWLLFGACYAGWLWWRHRDQGERPTSESTTGDRRENPSTFSSELYGFAPVFLVGAALLHFLLPRFEVADVDGTPLGLAVRGYGVCMLLAILAGVFFAWKRCQQTGFPFDRIMSLAMWMIFSGLLGARIFYLVQKNRHHPLQISDIPFALINMTEGGLVVYGAIMGGILAVAGYCWYFRQPLFRIADILAPPMAIGLAIGRFGCLLNGCCFGGPCVIEATGLHFPAGSPPYHRQFETGRLIGLTTRPWLHDGERVAFQMDANSNGIIEKDEFDHWATHPQRLNRDVEALRNESFFEGGRSEVLTTYDLQMARRVEAVASNSIAAKAGIEPDDLVVILPPSVNRFMDTLRKIHSGTGLVDEQFTREPFTIRTLGGTIGGTIGDKQVAVPMGQLPGSSEAVEPTQIYSSINAAVIFLFLWFYFPYRRAHGELFAWMLILYAITRFCLEAIRIDELPFWGPFSISQTVSFGVFILGVVMLIYCRSKHGVDFVEKTSVADR